MDSETQPRRNVPWLTLGMILFFMYPLSVGPATWMHSRGYLSPAAKEILEFIYQPIGWLHENSQVAADLLQRYLSWWS